MPNLCIKDVPQDLARALRERATRNHRSLQGELMASARRPSVPAADARAAAVAVVRPAGQHAGSLTSEDIPAQRRARFPEPRGVGPRGVDIIRVDRNARGLLADAG